MGPEVTAAAAFISRLLATTGSISEQQLRVFNDCLRQSLTEHYEHHWFPERPQKGSGYRCIRINHKMDPLVGRAAGRVGLSGPQLFQLLPRELTLWVDPFDVSYRIGEDGSICVLYEAAPTQALGPNSSAHGPRFCQNSYFMVHTSPPKNHLIAVSIGHNTAHLLRTS